MNAPRVVLVIVILILAMMAARCVGASVRAEELATFGTSAKEVRVLADGNEAELLSHEGRGCLTHMWFGGDWPGWEHTRIQCYVDGEFKASIEMELFLGHGIGFGDEAAPWGTERLGKTGHPSGVFNSYRIPFGKSIRVTAQAVAGLKEDPPFWWIIRGVENMPVEFGGIRLPDDARLKLYRVEERKMDPLEMLDLCNVPNGGLLYQVTLSVKSGNLNFLEACMRAYLDGAKEPMLLSSGTEDYFLGTYYFNRGMYHFPMAGLTHLDPKTNTFSAYRFHEQDPILFRNGMRLVWRNGEATEDGKKFGDPQPSTFTSYVWVYEWESAAGK